MTETTKVDPDRSIIDKVEAAAEKAAARGVEKGVAQVVADYGRPVLVAEFEVIAGGIVAALIVWSVTRFFARSVVRLWSRP